MLRGATAFNQSLSTWELNSNVTLTDLFTNSGIDCANITRTLQGWANNPSTPDSLSFSSYNINYATQAVEAITTLTNKGWTIRLASEVECEALPVSLLYFNAEKENSTVQLNWATIGEKNHAYFQVQRSADAKQWTPIGQVQGHGTVTTQRNYQFIDTTPLATTNYYRLAIVDNMEAIEYSRFIAIEGSLLTQPTLYPNPATDAITLRNYTSGLTKIYSSSGQLVKQVYITNKQQPVPLNDLKAGTYVIQSVDGVSQLFVKVN